MKKLLGLATSLLVVGCGAPNKQAPQTDSIKQVAISHEEMENISLINRSSYTSIDVPTQNYDPKKAYVAVLNHADETVSPVIGKINEGSFSFDLSRVDEEILKDATSLSVFKIDVDLTRGVESELIYEEATSRANDGKPMMFILHGHWADSTAMKAFQDAFRNYAYCHRVYSISYNTYKSIDKSAADIKSHMQSLNPSNRDIMIIAHSQGGIEARYLVEKLGMDNQIKNLVMIGTPNNGAGNDYIRVRHSSLKELFSSPFAIASGLMLYVYDMFINNPLKGNGYDYAGPQMAVGSTFLKDLNQPSNKYSVKYYTIAGLLLGLTNTEIIDSNIGDILVLEKSCHYEGLSQEADWTAGGTFRLTNHGSLNEVSWVVDATKEYFNDVFSSSESTTYASFPVNPVTTTTTPTNQPASPTVTTTGQITLDHPASRWDYGEAGFWYSEGKWHAAARRVDVGPPLEAVQMDGRDGTIKSGVSGRGYSYQRCQNGILINLGTDVLGLKSEFWNHYQQIGGARGELGCLTTEQQYDQRSGVNGQNGEWAQFEGGYLTKFNGLTTTVLGDFARVWNGKGKGQGELGYPKDYRRAVKSGAPQYVNTSGGWGLYQPFEGGCIAEWSQTEHVITGGFFREYERTGGPSGPMGYPLTAKRTGVRSGCSARYGEEQIFQHGRLCELGVNNAWAVYGGMLSRYSGPEYRHGFPLGPSTNDNHTQRFEEFTINW